MAAQIVVRGVCFEGLPRLFDCLIDDLKIVLDDRDRRLVEPAAAVLQRLLEIADRRIVLRVGKGDRRDVRAEPVPLD
jgi:hypothetical protein